MNCDEPRLLKACSVVRAPVPSILAENDKREKDLCQMLRYESRGKLALPLLKFLLQNNKKQTYFPYFCPACILCIS